MSSIGDRIREVRNSLEMNGDEFGKALNVTKVAVSNWENNNRTPDATMLVKIADLGGVSTDYLLCRTDKRTNFVYETTVDGKPYKIETNYGTKIEDNALLNKLIKQLETVGFDVDKLINSIEDDNE